MLTRNTTLHTSSTRTEAHCHSQILCQLIVCNCILTHRSLFASPHSVSLGFRLCSLTFSGPLQRTRGSVANNSTHPALLRFRCNKRVHLFRINQSNQSISPLSFYFLIRLYRFLNPPPASSILSHPLLIVGSDSLVCGKEKNPMISGVRSIVRFLFFLFVFVVVVLFCSTRLLVVLHLRILVACGIRHPL